MRISNTLWIFFNFCLFWNLSFQQNGTPLRYLGINVGNAGMTCWESKLCEKPVVEAIRSYINKWQPDIILFSEIYRESQLLGTDNYGPVVPSGYDGTCHASIDRFTQKVVAYDAADASHEHECVAWKKSRIKPITGTAKSVFGRNDAYGKKKNCHYDFTAFSIQLNLDGLYNITAVAPHPDSGHDDCRTYEIKEFWTELAGVDPSGVSDKNVIIGGDWNAGKVCYPFYCKDSLSQIQKPESFQINYQIGQHWNLHNDTTPQPTVEYFFSEVWEWLDAEYSNFGSPCTDCGKHYNTTSLPFGSAVGGYNGMPRADGGSGCDHRQVLVDMWLTKQNTRV